MSTLKADTIVASDGSSPVTLTKQSAAKAWVIFGDTVSAGNPVINESFNQSSLTDHGTGNYGANLTNAMSDANQGLYGMSSTGE